MIEIHTALDGAVTAVALGVYLVMALFHTGETPPKRQLTTVAPFAVAAPFDARQLFDLGMATQQQSLIIAAPDELSR